MNAVLKNVRNEVRLNVDVPKVLKRRLNTYCAQNDMKIKEFVTIYLELALEELEGEQ